MRYSLGVYEKAMPNLSWEEKMNAAKLAGFDRIEISIDESDERLLRLYEGIDYVKNLVSLQLNTGIHITTMCLSGHRRYPLGSHIKDVRDKGMEIMKKAIEFSYLSGIRIIQLAGYDVYYNEKSDYDSKQYFIENLIKSVQVASKHGVILAFETMENEFMNTVGKAMEYVELIDSPYLKIYPDIGNIANATDDVLADIVKGKGHIVAAHLKETVPGVFRNMRFGEGHVDFEASINQLKEIGVYTYTAEFWHDKSKDYLQEMKHSIDFLKPYLEGV